MSQSLSGGEPDTSKAGDPHSSFRLEITLSIGYQRRRALIGGKWEGRLVTFGLLLGGIAVVVVWLLILSQIRLP